MLRLVNTVARVVIAVLDALFPGPDDDTMTLAEAFGVTAEQQEAREYHVAASAWVEGAADARAELHDEDFAEWSWEITMTGGEQ